MKVSRIIMTVAVIFLLFLTYGCTNHNLKYAKEHGRMVGDCIQCEANEYCKEWDIELGHKTTYCLNVPPNATKILTPREQCQANGGIPITSAWDGRLKDCLYKEEK